MCKFRRQGVKRVGVSNDRSKLIGSCVSYRYYYYSYPVSYPTGVFVVSLR